MNTNNEQVTSKTNQTIDQLVDQVDKLKQLIEQTRNDASSKPTPAPAAIEPQKTIDRINQAIDKSHNIPTRHNTTGVTHIIIHASHDRLHDRVKFSIHKILRDETVIDIYEVIIGDIGINTRNLYQQIVDTSDFDIRITFASITNIVDVNFVFIDNKRISYSTLINWPYNVSKLNNSEILCDTLDITSRILDTYNNLRYTVHYGLTSDVELKFNCYTDSQKIRKNIADFAMNMITYAFINDE
jgi:hypothetical protein